VGDLTPAATPAMLELRDVRRHFGGIRAVDGVSLVVDDGAVVALIGPNGAGKSTLFALIMGEIPVSGGAILLDGCDIRGLSPERHTRLGVGRTFQTPRLFAGLSVAENVQIALLARARGDQKRRRPVRSDWGAVGSDWVRSHWGALRARAYARASHPQKKSTPPIDGEFEAALSEVGLDGEFEAALSEVGLDDQAALPAASLSQGQRKRLELAMVLALEPRLLLLDEPTAGMGVGERATIMELVMAAVRRRRLTMLFTEHDMDTVFTHAQRVVVMDRGALVADGAPKRVRDDPNVQQIYLGVRAGRDAP
jgi:ABC-type branched-subunit amino acid transport system ATPase component